MLTLLHVPLLKPEDVVPHLADPKHWREGYSAQELARSWAAAKNDFPLPVRLLLKQVPEYSDARLVEGLFEHEVDIRSKGKNSQTDLLVVTDLGEELAIIAVEAKVKEPFANLVRAWNSSKSKQTRLEGLCRTLNLDHLNVGGLRYQLLHRAASAIYEAQRFRCKHAMVLVHSFSASHCSFDDFSAFAKELQQPILRPNSCSDAQSFEGVSLRLAWVSDMPSKSLKRIPA